MNVVALVGRLVKDMEFGNPATTKAGRTTLLAKGTIAVDRKGGKKEVDFIPIQTWISETQRDKYHGVYMKKGALVSINGVVRVDNYEKDGATRVFTSIQGEVQLMSPSKNEGGNQPSQQGGFTPTNSMDMQEFESIDSDDIPF